MFMHEPKWMPTKTIIIQNHRSEDGLQEDNYLTPMLWIHPPEEPGGDSQDQKTSTTTHPHMHQEEDLRNEEEEEGVHAKTLGK